MVCNHTKFLWWYLLSMVCNHTKYIRLYVWSKSWNHTNYIHRGDVKTKIDVPIDIFSQGRKKPLPTDIFSQGREKHVANQPFCWFRHLPSKCCHRDGLRYTISSKQQWVGRRKNWWTRRAGRAMVTNLCRALQQFLRATASSSEPMTSLR